MGNEKLKMILEDVYNRWEIELAPYLHEILDEEEDSEIWEEEEND